MKNALELADKYEGKVDKEVVELGALLHDIAMPSEYGKREEHDIYGAKIAKQLLTELNYSTDKIKHVENCVLNHRGLEERPRNTIEEQIVADSDVISHFDSLPGMFRLAYKENNLSVQDGAEFVKKKLERDFNKLSPRTQKELKLRYENIIKVLF